jgi:hypothetical protein
MRRRRNERRMLAAIDRELDAMEAVYEPQRRKRTSEELDAFIELVRRNP